MHGAVSLPLIRRTFDPAFLNEVANDPAVRPGLQGAGAVDLTGIVANPSNYALQSDYGGFVLTLHEPGVYEVHSLFLPGHGTHPVRAMREAEEWMFTRTDCHAVLSRVPASNKAAKGFAITGGLRPLFHRNDALLGLCEYVHLPLMRWAMDNADLERVGEAFHEFLEAEKGNGGSSLPAHPHDPAHERAVGAASLMIQRGQAAKGVAFYNSWARFAGYAELVLLSTAPLVLDVQDAVVGFGDQGMEMLLCRSVQ